MTRFLIEVEGQDPIVTLPARTAALIESVWPAIDEVRTAMRGRNDEVYAALLAIRMASLHVRARSEHALRAERGSTCACSDLTGTPVADVSEHAASSSRQVVTSSDVARRAGVTTRAVLLARQRDRLRGELVGGRWRFDETDVAVWMATRREG